MPSHRDLGTEIEKLAMMYQYATVTATYNTPTPSHVVFGCRASLRILQYSQTPPHPRWLHLSYCPPCGSYHPFFAALRPNYFLKYHLKEVVKKTRIFYGQADRKGGVTTPGLTVAFVNILGFKTH